MKRQTQYDLADNWNRLVEPHDTVLLEISEGVYEERQTKSLAWVAGGAQCPIAVVMLEGSKAPTPLSRLKIPSVERQRKFDDFFDGFLAAAKEYVRSAAVIIGEKYSVETKRIFIERLKDELSKL